jgi:hypothetical protein
VSLEKGVYLEIPVLQVKEEQQGLRENQGPLEQLEKGGNPVQLDQRET